MTKTIYVLFSGPLQHGGRSGIKVPPHLDRSVVIEEQLKTIPRNTFLYAQLYGELHGARPFPLIALFHQDQRYSTSVQIAAISKLHSYPITNQGIYLTTPKPTELEPYPEPEYESIDKFVDRAIRHLDQTKRLSTNLVIDTTTDKHYQQDLRKLMSRYQIKELTLD